MEILFNVRLNIKLFVKTVRIVYTYFNLTGFTRFVILSNKFHDFVCHKLTRPHARIIYVKELFTTMSRITRRVSFADLGHLEGSFFQPGNLRNARSTYLFIKAPVK